MNFNSYKGGNIFQGHVKGMELNGCFFTYQKMFFVSNIGLLMHVYIDTNLCELFYTPTSDYTTQYKGTSFKGLCKYQHPGFRISYQPDYYQHMDIGAM